MAAKWTIDVRRTDNGYWCAPEGIVPMQIRSPFSNLKVAELAEEMKRDGRQRDPVTCRKVAGMPHLLDGNRRLAAVKYINKHLSEGEQPWQVWFVVQDVENELDAILTAATLNATMVMSPLDRAHMYALALREGNLTQEQLAEKIHKTAAHVSQHLSLLRLGEAEQKAIADGKIGFSAALDLVSLPEASRQQVVEAVSAAETPMTGSEVKELAATARRESAPPDGGGSDTSEASRRKMVLSPSKFRAIVTGLGERNSSFLPLANVFESLWYGEITETEFEEEWAEFIAKLHFDYFEKLKADGRIKGVNV